MKLIKWIKYSVYKMDTQYLLKGIYNSKKSILTDCPSPNADTQESVTSQVKSHCDDISLLLQ